VGRKSDPRGTATSGTVPVQLERIGMSHHLTARSQELSDSEWGATPFSMRRRIGNVKNTRYSLSERAQRALFDERSANYPSIAHRLTFQNLKYRSSLLRAFAYPGEVRDHLVYLIVAPSCWHVVVECSSLGARTTRRRRVVKTTGKEAPLYGRPHMNATGQQTDGREFWLIYTVS